LQQFFHVPVNEHRHVGFDSGGPIEFRALGRVDLMNDFDRRVSLARQKFNLRFWTGRLLRDYCLIAHFFDGSTLLNAPMLSQLQVQVIHRHEFCVPGVRRRQSSENELALRIKIRNPHRVSISASWSERVSSAATPAADSASQSFRFARWDGVRARGLHYKVTSVTFNIHARADAQIITLLRKVGRETQWSLR
jgi:hypothetical protein